MTRLVETAAWRALADHHRAQSSAGGLKLRELFATDPRRFERLALRLDDTLLVDLSKNLVTHETVRLLVELARERDVEGWRARMFGGERINTTEDRAVLHTALRNRSDRPVLLAAAGGDPAYDVMPGVRDVLARMRAFIDEQLDGITDVVNLGIGGSDLGPAMVTEALRPYWRPGITSHYVSNVDGAHIAQTLMRLSPDTTLFVVASKSFSTIETLTNARTARSWVREHLGERGVRERFVAVSQNRAAVAAFGADPERTFDMWDWVGGRLSLWSAIGLPIACAVGMDRFEELLEGACAMDEHFRTRPLEANIPVLLALLGVWYGGFEGAPTHAILPYDQSLHRLPAWLQQLDMESNGKRVDREGGG